MCDGLHCRFDLAVFETNYRLPEIYNYLHMTRRISQREALQAPCNTMANVYLQVMYTQYAFYKHREALAPDMYSEAPRPASSYKHTCSVRVPPTPLTAHPCSPRNISVRLPNHIRIDSEPIQKDHPPNCMQLMNPPEFRLSE